VTSWSRGSLRSEKMRSGCSGLAPERFYDVSGFENDDDNISSSVETNDDVINVVVRRRELPPSA
jgi:hypothetical protein